MQLTRGESDVSHIGSNARCVLWTEKGGNERKRDGGETRACEDERGRLAHFNELTAGKENHGTGVTAKCLCVCVCLISAFMMALFLFFC